MVVLELTYNFLAYARYQSIHQTFVHPLRSTQAELFIAKYIKNIWQESFECLVNGRMMVQIITFFRISCKIVVFYRM